MTKTFPADFYVACATIIPVLFIAIAVQGNMIDEMMRVTLKTAGKTPGRLGDSFVSVLLPVAAWVALAAGVIGEWGALGSLFSQSDSLTTRRLVMGMTLYLVAVAAAGPVGRYLQASNALADLADKEQQQHDEEPG